MRTLLALTLYTLRAVGQATQGPVVNTTSGRFIGVENDGVMSFKGIRFGEAPVGDLRWSTPQASFSNQTQNATFFAPSCIQQFAFATQEFITDLFNNPPVPESEDCLFLNVWAPTTYSGNTLKPVVVWVYGGSLAFGTSSFPLYDGTSFAKNQDIVVVSFNYRTNIFGFPQSPDLALLNLGFLDQELAFQWVQENIKQFGGDKEHVTITGESAGAESVSLAIARHTPTDAPFRAGIMFSGASVSSTPRYNFSAFNNFASAAGCTQATGSPARLQCLKAIPTGSIRNFTNGPTSGSFGAIVDNVTMTTLCKDDGTLFTIGFPNLTFFLSSALGSVISPDSVRALYPGRNDSEIIADAIRELFFRCPAGLWSSAFVESGVPHVYRYSYGAVFPDLQLFPGAGAWHSSELPEVFGTFNASTATAAEVALSKTFQTAIANFIKDPTTSPAENWPSYVPVENVSSLGEIAYDGNVDPDNFVQAVSSDSLDAPCEFWNRLLDYRP